MSLAFDHAALLLLALPLGFALVRWRDGRTRIDALRAACALLLVIALARPSLRVGEDGRDLVVVVDRSESMPADGVAIAHELVRLAEEARGPAQRLAVVSFGAEPAVEQLPERDGAFAGVRAPHDASASDLAAALELALELVPDGRPARVLVVSDGEASGPDPVAAARAARLRGVDVTARPVLRPAESDLAAARLDVPAEVAAGEPFQFSAWVRADAPREAGWRLLADGVEVASGAQRFEGGWTRVSLRDRPRAPGLASYRFELVGAADRTPENDAVLGAVRVRGETRVLVLDETGHASALAAALRAGGLVVDTRRPEDVALDLVALEDYAAVVLENVAAPRVGSAASAELARFVLERGRGLLMTGGRASFARGGWWRSALDAALAVDLDPRDEDRRVSVAIGIALDRSGSMSVPAGRGTKMDLANDGVVRAIELLGPGDAVAVLAVDTSPHVVLPLTQVTDPSSLAARARRVQSEGGGIFVRVALERLVRELEPATQANRHLILFADAADSEQQEGCVALAQQLAASGAVLSVIALGTETDPDAAFLRALAGAGGGQAWFTTSATDLPELFAQEVASATRGGLVEERTGVRALGALVELGADATGFTAVGGYHLAKAREHTLVGLEVADERRSPLLVFGRRGLGRSAAYLGQVGGGLGDELVAWQGFAPLFSSLARWLTADAPPADVHADARVERGTLVVDVELGPEAARRHRDVRWTATISHPRATTELALERVAVDRFRGTLRLAETGVHLGVVALPDGGVLDLPPLVHSTSPEHLVEGDPARGRRLLERLVEASGGAPFASATDLWTGAAGGSRRVPLWPWLAAAAVVVLLAEIGVRRLDLFAARARVRRERPAPAPATAVSPQPAPAVAATAEDEPAQAEPEAADDAPARSMLRAVREQRAKRRGG